MKYRIFNKHYLYQEPMGYIVQQKKWYQIDWENVQWFATEEEANEYINKLKEK